MNTSDSAFELIMQELLKQKYYLEELVRENQGLRSQLADLRAGIGISVDILGQQFSLAVTSLETLATIQMPTVTDQAATAASENSDAERIPEDVAPSPSPAFVEEMIFDELASVGTTPLAVWSGSTTKALPDDEEEKAALRRELTGSFLLE